MSQGLGWVVLTGPQGSVRSEGLGLRVSRGGISEGREGPFVAFHPTHPKGAAKGQGVVPTHQ